MATGHSSERTKHAIPQKNKANALRKTKAREWDKPLNQPRSAAAGGPKHPVREVTCHNTNYKHKQGRQAMPLIVWSSKNLGCGVAMTFNLNKLHNSTSFHISPYTTATSPFFVSSAVGDRRRRSLTIERER